MSRSWKWKLQRKKIELKGARIRRSSYRRGGGGEEIEGGGEVIERGEETGGERRREMWRGRSRRKRVKEDRENRR